MSKGKKTSEPVPTGTLRQEMLPARVHAWVSLTLCPDVLSLSLSLSLVPPRSAHDHCAYREACRKHDAHG